MQARELLRHAGIPAYLREEHRAGMIGGMTVMVPASLSSQSARDDADRRTFRPSYIRHGMGAVRPYLYGTPDLLDFVDSRIRLRGTGAHEFGSTAIHVEVMIGDSVVVMEVSDPPHASAGSVLDLVYVEDVDATYELALEAGAVSLAEPADKPYDERSAGVKDSFGNTWWISTYTGA